MDVLSSSPHDQVLVIRSDLGWFCPTHFNPPREADDFGLTMLKPLNRVTDVACLKGTGNPSCGVMQPAAHKNTLQSLTDQHR